MSGDIDASLVPERLADLEQWICWQETERDGKATKVPIKPYHTNGTPNASTTESANWRDLESALAFHESDRVRTNGIGFVFASATPIVGVDLDDCRDPTTGELASWAQDIVDRLDSYTEVSPSGCGVHVIVDGELPAGRNRRDNVEMYDEARFFTVTTDHVQGTPKSLECRTDDLLGVHYEYVQSPPDAETGSGDIDEEAEEPAASEVSVDGRGRPVTESTDRKDSEGTDVSETGMALGSDSGLYGRYGLDYPEIEDPGLEAALHGLSPSALPSPLPTSIEDIAGPGVDLDDETVLERAMDSKRGRIIEALYTGRDDLWKGRDSRYPSQSEADMGLCFYLGFWTGGDPERMDRLFRESGLYRGKWDGIHFANGATYGEVCIARTLLQVDDYYRPSSTSAEAADGASHTPSPDTEPDSDIDQSSEPAATTTIDAHAVRDARRLATKVQRQQRELQDQREYIEALETQLQWYRAAFGGPSDRVLFEEVGDNLEPVSEISDDSSNSVSSISDSSRFHSSSTAQPEDYPASIETDGESTIDPEDEEDPESGPEGDSDQSAWVADWVRRWFS